MTEKKQTNQQIPLPIGFPFIEGNNIIKKPY